MKAGRMWAEAVLTGIVRILGWYLGGMDDCVCALIAMMAASSMSAVLRSIVEKKICIVPRVQVAATRAMMFLVVGAAHIADVYLFGNGWELRIGAIRLYLAYEGASLLENAEAVGLPVPGRLKGVLELFHKKQKTDRTDKDKEK